jgi:hypothetical protein
LKRAVNTSLLLNRAVNTSLFLNRTVNTGLHLYGTWCSKGHIEGSCHVPGACLEAGLSQRRPDLDPIPIQLQFSAKREVPRQILPPLLQSSLLRTVSPTLHIRLPRTLYNLPINWERNSLTHIQTTCRQLNDE